MWLLVHVGIKIGQGSPRGKGFHGNGRYDYDKKVDHFVLQRFFSFSLPLAPTPTEKQQLMMFIVNITRTKWRLNRDQMNPWII